MSGTALIRAPAALLAVLAAVALTAGPARALPVPSIHECGLVRPGTANHSLLDAPGPDEV